MAKAYASLPHNYLRAIHRNANLSFGSAKSAKHESPQGFLSCDLKEAKILLVLLALCGHREISSLHESLYSQHPELSSLLLSEVVSHDRATSLKPLNMALKHGGSRFQSKQDILKEAVRLPGLDVALVARFAQKHELMDEDIAKFFIEAGLDVNARLHRKRTLLMDAVQGG